MVKQIKARTEQITNNPWRVVADAIPKIYIPPKGTHYAFHAQKKAAEDQYTKSCYEVNKIPTPKNALINLGAYMALSFHKFDSATAVMPNLITILKIAIQNADDSPLGTALKKVEQLPAEALEQKLTYLYTRREEKYFSL